jgi:hypothetical protein
MLIKTIQPPKSTLGGIVPLLQEILDFFKLREKALQKTMAVCAEEVHQTLVQVVHHSLKWMQKKSKLRR